MRAVVHDGLSARAQPVDAAMTDAGLVVHGGDRDTGGAAGDVETIAAALLRRSGPRTARIVRRIDQPDWRLVPDEAASGWVDQLADAGTLTARARGWLAGSVAAVLLAAAGLWLWGDDLLSLAAPLVPAGVTRPVGEAVVASLGGTPCDGVAGTAALDRLVVRLQPYGSVEPVSVAVLDTAAVNALAAPGGRIVVFRGLIDKAKSSDEVAGVVAHELTHVALRHPAKALIRAMGLSLIVRALGGDMGNAVDVAGVLHSSRKAERDADAGALDLLRAAHIAPGGIAAFFQRMRDEARARPADAIGSAIDTVSRYADSHPGADERVTASLAAVARQGTVTPAMSPADWQALRGICMG